MDPVRFPKGQMESVVVSDSLGKVVCNDNPERSAVSVSEKERPVGQQ